MAAMDYKQLGAIGGGIAITVGLVLQFLGTHVMPNKNGLPQETLKQIEVLYDLHIVRDQDGVPVWYVPRSLSKAIEDLTRSIDGQGGIMIELKSAIENQTRTLERIERSGFGSIINGRFTRDRDYLWPGSDRSNVVGSINRSFTWDSCGDSSSCSAG